MNCRPSTFQVSPALFNIHVWQQIAIGQHRRIHDKVGFVSGELAPKRCDRLNATAIIDESNADGLARETVDESKGF